MRNRLQSVAYGLCLPRSAAPFPQPRAMPLQVAAVREGRAVVARVP